MSRTHFLILNDKIVAFYIITIDNVEIDVVSNQTIECRLPVLKVISFAVDETVQDLRIGFIMIKQILQKQYNPMRFLHHSE